MDRSPNALQDEVRAAQAVVQPHATGLENEWLRACGKFYADARENSEVADDPENYRQAWLRSFLSETASGLPQAIIEADGIEWPEERAYVLEQAVNRRVRQARGFREFVHRTAVDYGFRSARAVCYMGRERGSKVDQPMVKRLAFEDLLFDSTVDDRCDARWIGHRVVRDIDDVIRDAEENKSTQWNVKYLKQIKESLTSDPKRRQKGVRLLKRQELVYWCLWEPGFQADSERGEDQGYYGTVHYVLDPQIGALGKGRSPWLRKSEPWFGHCEGPYAFAAGMRIGDLPIELSPLVGGASQGAWLNDVARALRKAVQSYKRNPVLMSDELMGLLQAADNGVPVAVTGGSDVRSMVQVIESGGMTEQMLTAFQLAMESAQRALGTYSNLGEVQEDATATSINAAAIGYASTMHLHTSAYRDFQAQVLSRWAFWYGCHPDSKTMVGPLPGDVALPLGIDPRAPFIPLEGAQDQAPMFRSMNLKVDVHSTRQKDSMAMQQDMAAVMEFHAWIASLGSFAAAQNLDRLQRLFARSRGVRDFERLLDSGLVQMIAAGQQSQPTATASGKTQVGFSGRSGGYGGGSAPTPLGNAGRSKPAANGLAPKPASSAGGPSNGRVGAR